MRLIFSEVFTSDFSFFAVDFGVVIPLFSKVFTSCFAFSGVHFGGGFYVFSALSFLGVEVVGPKSSSQDCSLAVVVVCLNLAKLVLVAGLSQLSN